MGSPQEHFAGHPFALSVLERARELAERAGPCETRVTTSQVALRRGRTFAWVWLPGRYLRTPTAEVVLSVALGRHDPSPRWKQVAHPSPQHWVHHLEVHALTELDDEVAGWLREASERTL
jgi:hypothetical protein